mmetsp:Transcript_29599/g.53525  ORF Transcript_29599/g.53525 Transcript_29599/m.53525 type:complete len:201 (-) Transcript_29599:76-678(-)
MMTRNGRLDIIRCTQHIVDRLLGRNVLHGNVEGWKVWYNALHNFLNKDGFAFENIRVCHFRMNTQPHAHLLHGLKCWINVGYVRDSKFRVGSSTCRIVFASVNHARGVCLFNFFRGRLVGKIERHEWLKCGRCNTRWKTVENELTVFQRLFSINDWWHCIGHDDASSKSFAGMLQHCPCFVSISYVMMKIIRKTNGNALG